MRLYVLDPHWIGIDISKHWLQAQNHPAWDGRPLPYVFSVYTGNPTTSYAIHWQVNSRPIDLADYIDVLSEAKGWGG